MEKGKFTEENNFQLEIAKRTRSRNREIGIKEMYFKNMYKCHF